MAKFLPKLSEQTDRLRKLLKKEQGPCLAHYAKKENIVPTDASTTGLGTTLWQKQVDGNTKPIAFRSRYQNDTEKKYSIGELELLAVVWGLEKFRFYLYGKKVHLYTDHQALELLIKRNRSNNQYSARLTRWLDRLTHFDISIQHIAGNNLKFTYYLSRTPVGGATPEESYDEEYVINILSEQAKLTIEYGPIFDDQSKSEKAITETKKNTSEERNENRANQSQKNKTFENENNVDKHKHQRNIKTTSGQSKISTLERRHSTKEAKSLNQIQKSRKLNTEIAEMDRENFYH